MTVYRLKADLALLWNTVKLFQKAVHLGEKKTSAGGEVAQKDRRFNRKKTRSKGGPLRGRGWFMAGASNTRLSHLVKRHA